MTRLVKPVSIFLDANFYFIPLKFKVDIFAEFDRIMQVKYELILLSPVLDELHKIHDRSSGKQKREAAFALDLTAKCKIRNVELLSKESVDDMLVRVAKSESAIVATSDKLLRKKLQQQDIKAILLRSKTHLDIV